MKNTFIISATVLLLSNATIMADRQESTRELKKVVYTGICANYPQTYNGVDWWARIPVPELSLDNAPSFNLYVRGGNQHAGWPDSEWRPVSEPNVVFGNGVCLVK